ncbi:MAG TPA: pentapeptide repeat-containing protein [Acidobacteriaceae bacterium]|nr:pentapeptide repeat-containing protein [Acidobacteriaceae bacterium]
MILHHARNRPLPWAERRARIRRRWLVPLLAFDFVWEWIAYLLSNWSFLEVLEYLGSFSVLIGVIFWFSESRDRVMQRHYQAWQVINTAQGKGGSGGRIEALQELNADRVPLTGVDVSSAFLQGLRVPRARLARSSFSAADLRDSDLHRADLSWADLHFANLRQANLEAVVFDHANLQDCDFSGADLAEASLEGADLSNADFRAADLRRIRWEHIATIRNANLAGVRHPPTGFLAWALRNGAVQQPPQP